MRTGHSVQPVPPAGAVLVGGASRRMGRPKAWLHVGGEMMAVRVAGALAGGGCEPVRLIGATATEVPPGPARALEAVADRYPGEGPLGGVITALRTAAGDRSGGAAGDVAGDVVVAACDLPGLVADDVARLLRADPDRQAPVVVARVGDRHVPLAWWRAAALEPVEAAFAAGVRSWSAALAALGAVTVPMAARGAADVDTPAELRAARASDEDRAGHHRDR